MIVDESKNSSPESRGSSDSNIEIVTREESSVVTAHFKKVAIRAFATRLGIPESEKITIATQPLPKHLPWVDRIMPEQDFTSKARMRIRRTLFAISTSLANTYVYISPMMTYNGSANEIEFYTDLPIIYAERAVEEAWAKRQRNATIDQFAFAPSQARKDTGDFLYKLAVEYKAGHIDKEIYQRGISLFCDWFVSRFELSGAMAHELKHHSDKNSGFSADVSHSLRKRLIRAVSGSLPVSLGTSAIHNLFGYGGNYDTGIKLSLLTALSAGVGAALIITSTRNHYFSKDEFERRAREAEAYYWGHFNEIGPLVELEFKKPASNVSAPENERQ